MNEGVKNIRVREVHPLSLDIQVGSIGEDDRAYLTVRKKLYKTSDGRFILMKV